MVLDLYNHASTRTFLVALVVACLTVIPLLGMELEESEKKIEGNQCTGDRKGRIIRSVMITEEGSSRF